MSDHLFDARLLRCGPTTFCPWCLNLVRTFQRRTHLRECGKRPAWEQS